MGGGEGGAGAGSCLDQVKRLRGVSYAWKWAGRGGGEDQEDQEGEQEEEKKDREEAGKLLRQRFGYAFEGRNGYHPTVDGRILPDGLRIGDIDIACVDQPHGEIYSTGFRFSHGGRSVAYATDFHDLTPDMLALYDRVDVWVVDALREKPHPTHPHLALTLDGIAAARPGRAILTHMDQSMDYATLRRTLPSGVEPGYDGMAIVLEAVEQGD